MQPELLEMAPPRALDLMAPQAAVGVGETPMLSRLFGDIAQSVEGLPPTAALRIVLRSYFAEGTAWAKHETW
jgi:hypothetical protein